MALSNVWIQTLTDGLLRADQVTGIAVHRTPALSGKPSRWLVDVVLPISAGSGTGDTWTTGSLHRTLTQTHDRPDQAPETLARLLAQLDAVNAAGIITPSLGADNRPGTAVDRIGDSADPVLFRFTPFPAAQPGRLDDPEFQ